VKHKILKAHASPLYKVRPIDENLFASGDDDGFVKLWDNRVRGSGDASGTAVMECKQFNEFVGDLYVGEGKRIMVAASGDGKMIGHIY
jgi:hypothetical protein